MHLLKQIVLGMLDYYRFPERRHSWGSAFNHQEHRKRIFLELIAKLEPSCIVETGTYHGTTTEYMHQHTRSPIFTTEMNPRTYGFALARFKGTSAVKVFCKDSRTFLDQLILPNERAFFYLDAHWNEDLPLKEEVEIIFRKWPKAVIMIDDFQVPDDPDYTYDNYGPEKTLNLDYLQMAEPRFFFPSLRGAEETGAKRGCVVLAKDLEVTQKLGDCTTLRPH